MLFFLHPLFLTALACVGVPILLHFLMRPRPKKYMFPALRFLQAHEKNRKSSLRLKHFLLLAVRILLLAAVVLLFARPSILYTSGENAGSAEEKSMKTSENRTGHSTENSTKNSTETVFHSSEPTAALLIFDTSVRMNYMFENHSSLARAQSQAEKIVAGLPAGSTAAVAAAHLAPLAFSPDRAEIIHQIQLLETSPNARPLPEVTAESLALFQNSDLPQKEIFIFTDETAASWLLDGSSGRNRLASALKKVPDAQISIIPVGVSHPSNTRLDVPEEQKFETGAGGVLKIRTHLQTQDSQPHRVGLFLLDANGIPQLRGEITAQNSTEAKNFRKSETKTETGTETTSAAETEAAIPLEFELGALADGPNQGFVQILDGDALSIDDTRYFTVQKDPPAPVLLVAEPPAEKNAFFVRQALSPTQFTLENRAEYACSVLSYEQFTRWLEGSAGRTGSSSNSAISTISAETQRGTLNQYAAVFFLDPPELSPAVWNRIAQYVNAGGGASFFFGPSLRKPAEVQIAEARQFLPALPGFQARFPDGTFFTLLRGTAHPITHAFEALGTSIPWDEYPVFRAWTLTEISDGAQTLFRWGNGSPALVAGNYGTGRVLVSGTPFHPTQSNSRTVWNLLPQADSWVFLVFVNASAQYLTSQEEAASHISPSDTLRIPLRGVRDEKFFLQKIAVSENVQENIRKNGEMWKNRNTEKTQENADITLLPDVQRRQLDVPKLEAVGNYRITGPESGFSRGFSVNLPLSQTDLTPVKREEIRNLFLPHEVTFLPCAEVLKRSVTGSRSGGELFQELALLIIALLFTELWLSNRFYTERT